MRFKRGLLQQNSVLLLAWLGWVWVGGCAAPKVAAPARQAAELYDPGSVERLEGPDRDRWQQPARVVRALKLRPGQAVADVGAGSGYLLPHLSRAVGPKGRVYAEEIQESFLGRLERRRRELGNVEVILGSPWDPRLPKGKIDAFVMLTVYHEVERPVDLLRRLHESARPGAKLAILDFDPDRKGDPPPPARHSVLEREVREEAALAGWRVVESHDFIPSQFFLILRADNELASIIRPK
jgi:arsenite methyltransferase